jgi:hypothetical protein
LAAGQLREGWALHESRWSKSSDPIRLFRQFDTAPWQHHEPIEGRRLLLHAEQGFGDTIQFLRYVRLAREQGAHTILDMPPPLMPLIATLDGVDELVSHAEPLPPFDLHCSLMSLPFALASEVIPCAVPYLSADCERKTVWAERLGPRVRRRVGLAWSGNPKQGNDHNRSMPLAALAPLFDLDIELFALQREVRPADAALLEATPQIRNLGPSLDDFADTAAIIDQLDLVITVDTSIGHLAGALARPVWVMLCFSPDWRWMPEQDNSLWYPTARLFRQPTQGDWASVVEQVVISLNRLEEGV